MSDPAAVLARCAAGDLSPTLALMQLFLASPDEGSARTVLAKELSQAEGAAHARLTEVQALLNESPGAHALVSRIAGAANPQPRSIAEWAQIFDAGARMSPEGSVALYSLGRADLLEEATGELVHYLDGQFLVGNATRVLEIGCGIGRIAGALAPKVASYMGVDISAVMLAQARQRVTARNVTFRQGNGRDLAMLPDGAFDLVLAVDVFPYLVAAGDEIVESNLRECARALRPEGRALIFNYSYRGDDARDRAELLLRAGDAGFAIERVERPLRIWDGLLFALRRDGA